MILSCDDLKVLLAVLHFGFGQNLNLVDCHVELLNQLFERDSEAWEAKNVHDAHVDEAYKFLLKFFFILVPDRRELFIPKDLHSLHDSFITLFIGLTFELV